MGLLRRLVKEESGQGIAEYGLIIALAAVIIVGVMILFRDQLRHVFQGLGEKITDPENTIANGSNVMN